MIPDDQKLDVVATLIVRTQRGELLWRREPVSAPLAGGGAVKSAVGGAFYEVSSDGLVFRVYRQDGEQVRGFQGIYQGVVLEIADQDDDGRRETIREIDDLPILRNLYEFASNQSKPLLKKIDQFLRKAG